MRWLLAVVMAALLLTTERHTGRADAEAPYDFSSVEALIQSEVAAGTFPGASMLIVKDGQTLYEQHFGTFGPTTTVPIASASKWVSGAVIMSLVDDGVLSLNDTVSEHLPDWTGTRGTITLRQLFSHTSGLVDSHACLGNAAVTLAQCVEQIRDEPMVSAPGTAFFYGGASMQVAGRIAEVATGKPWAQIFADQMRTPLGMTSTFYWPPSNPQIGGGVISRLDDYERMLLMLSQYGAFGSSQVLEPGTPDIMEADQTSGAAIVYSPHLDNRRYGIGMWRDIVAGDGEAIQLSSQGLFGMSPWLDRERRYFAIFFVQDQLIDVYVTVDQIQGLVRGIIDSHDTDDDGTDDGVDDDDDDDGQVDDGDACAVTATAWTTPPGDYDCDGFTLSTENLMGTAPTSACATTLAANDEPSPDGWPVDFNDDRVANTIDVLQYVGKLNYISPDPLYVQRFDLNADGRVNTVDVLKFVPFLNRSCA